MGAWSKRRVKRLNSISFNSSFYYCTRLFLIISFGVKNHYRKLFILLIPKGLCRSERFRSPPLLVMVNICCSLIKSLATLRLETCQKGSACSPARGQHWVSYFQDVLYLFGSKRFKTGVLTCRLPLDLQPFPGCSQLGRRDCSKHFANEVGLQK